MTAKGRLSCISLFCGAGGLDTGFKQAGFGIELAYDLNQAAVRTHSRNHRGSLAQVADLSAISPEEVVAAWRQRMGPARLAGVIGGPPCQAFSRSNVFKKAGDPRALLPENYAAILGHLNANIGLDFFLFENAAGLLGETHSHQMERFRSLFERAGFLLFEEKLDAVNYGVPQYRPRVLIVGFNKVRFRNAPAFKFPIPSKDAPSTVRGAIGDLAEPMYFRKDLVPEAIPIHPNHWCMNPRSRKFRSKLLRPGEIKGRSFRTLDWDKPSWTVAYGHREVHVHPSCKRRLSVYEAMLLQGFPNNYQLIGTLSDQIRLVSDAVPPPLGRAVAKSIMKHLEEGRSAELLGPPSLASSAPAAAGR